MQNEDLIKVQRLKEILGNTEETCKQVPSMTDADAMYLLAEIMVGINSASKFIQENADDIWDEVNGASEVEEDLKNRIEDNANI